MDPLANPEPKTVAEIAEILGITPRAVHLCLNSALTKLRATVSKDEFDDLLRALHPEAREVKAPKNTTSL